MSDERRVEVFRPEQQADAIRAAGEVAIGLVEILQRALEQKMQFAALDRELSARAAELDRDLERHAIDSEAKHKSAALLLAHIEKLQEQVRSDSSGDPAAERIEDRLDRLYDRVLDLLQ